MSSIPDTEVLPGEILAGKFRIEQVLGRGGMGVVVAATHLQLDEKVALKFLLPEALKHAEAVMRFEREARAAVKIKSEHVARVTDVGTLDNGSPYMVMEFLSGMDLGQYLERKGPLAIDEAVQYIMQACEAIAEAHSLGIVHRDLKPANLFRILRADGTPSIKVLDFGISKVTSGQEASMTQTSSMMGSPYYMSPEQMISSKNVDHRTDVWALGVILHELLTGKVPYEGETIPEVCAKVLQLAPPDLNDSRADAPWELQAVISRALAKKRDDRYQNVAEFSHALMAFGTADAQRSVERISRVLGVTPYPSNQSSLTSNLSSTNGTGADSPSAKESAHLRESSGKTSSAALDGLDITTLGGASNTQLDQVYTLPQHTRSKLPLVAVALLLVAGGGVWFSMSGTSSAVDSMAADSTTAELVPTAADAPADDAGALPPAKAAQPSSLGASDEPPEATIAKSESQKASDLGADEQIRSAQASSAKTQAANNAVLPAKKPSTKPSVQAKAAVKPKPLAKPKPAVQHVQPQAAVPAPAPKTPASLYLDRK